MISADEIKTSKREQYLLTRRDEEESSRLDQQSNLIRIFRDGNVLDPMIPKQNISIIADIATGTGIWLREVVGELADGGYNHPIETVGFDISAEQFPKRSAPGNKFVVWDMTNSFPQEYHSRFDIVHIRLVIFAIMAEQIKGVVENLVTLLKPGGYLQWTDLVFKNRQDLIPSINDVEFSCESEVEMMFKFVEEQGYYFDLIGDVEKALQSLPMEDVHVIDYTDAPCRRPEIRRHAAEWKSRGVAIAIEMISSRNGQSKEQAKMTADVFRKKTMEMGRRGMIFKTQIVTLIARRKS